MKKMLLFLFMISISLTIANAVEPVKTERVMDKAQIQKERQSRAAAFEKRLGLSDEQKIKAGYIRVQGHERLRPVMGQIMLKKQEAYMVKMSRMAVQMQEEKLKEIDEQIKALEKEATQIRKENMKEFESILTKEQKKILKQMKKEGRKKFNAEHPERKHNMMHPHPGFQPKMPIQTK